MNGHAAEEPMSEQDEDLMQLTLQLRNKKENDEKYAKFHGDKLIGNPIDPEVGLWEDVKAVFRQPSNWPALKRAIDGYIKSTVTDGQSLATIAGSLSDDSVQRQKLINGQVKEKYDKMLHPPLTYLGDAFQYRTADGKFNSAINPHLGQAGAPYAKTVPSKTAPLGALPDPSDLFDKLMAREKDGRQSQSGLSAMLIYHATIIIHDIFRTNDNDKNISDSSSYLDLSPLYGYNTEMQRKIRDDKYKLGLLKPDTFAEDRLLRQPPGVCIMLVMYNRYHNYAAKQLLRINENGRFTVPAMYKKTKLVSLIKEHLPDRNMYGQKEDLNSDVHKLCSDYEGAWRDAQAARPREAPEAPPGQPQETPAEKAEQEAADKLGQQSLDSNAEFKKSALNQKLIKLTKNLELLLEEKKLKLKNECPQKLEDFETKCKDFESAWEAARNKQDDDLFNTARLITCGMYIQISVHDYLRALMGFHQFNTNFTLDPRADFDQKKTSRGIGNQVTVEFNLLYRFHCAISLKDEAYTEEFMQKVLGFKDPRNTPLPVFLQVMAAIKQKAEEDKNEGKREPEPWEVTFGIPDSPELAPANGEGSSATTNNGVAVNRPLVDSDARSETCENGSDSGISMDHVVGTETPKKNGPAQEKPKKSKHFMRNSITNLFDDRQMLDELTSAMDDPISNFGPRNVPKCLKAVEIMGILQARKWETGTLNDFRGFFGLPRHATFESVTKNVEIQNALRDLYEHPDKIELYPGIFCESDEYMGLDPGPSQSSSALWTAIFSDAITLVRSDRFYTVDWNTNSLTSWGMKEVTPNNKICKSSVFHRLIQRAFPGWFPSDTIRFFHPFYTAKQNAIYAEAQGYGDLFKETVEEQSDKPKKPKTYIVVAQVQKPQKPWYLDKLDDISIVLQGEQSKNFTNPAYYYEANLPPVVRDVLDPGQKPPTISPKILEDYVKDVEVDLKKYLDGLMRYMVKRESISMTNSTFQIDATRDFAIPVVTQYVADFLGFANKLRKDATEVKDTYSENEIYQHITDCQVFLTYNADETKWMQRRLAFKTSMKKLIDLTQKGTIWEANQWQITRTWFGKKQNNAMHKLGVFVAKQVLDYEKDQRKAAAILLLICLDFAYNAVVSVSDPVYGYIGRVHGGLYRAADSPPLAIQPEPKWIEVQRSAFGTSSNADKELEQMIQVMAQATVRLPIVRKAIATDKYAFGWTMEGKKVEVKKGETVILDLSKAIDEAKVNSDEAEVQFLTSQLSIADKYGVFSPRRFATLSLTSMVKFIAQMKNPRRGHDAQGRLKRILLDSTLEGYANYMAPMRVDWIKEQVKRLKDKEADKIFTDNILRPEADTYLTPTWDEFVPFPMTWKIRFDGFGQSNYKMDNHPYGKVKTTPTLPDFCPPWYQPQGPSTVGGVFDPVVCICADAEVEAKDEAAQLPNGEAGKEKEKKHEHHCPCLGHLKKKLEPKTAQLSTGCGLSDNYMHK
ncbi:putative prostaglandin G/H synthase 2/cyclooxygenase 2, pgh2/cox2 [Dactylonectria estremocensis]|uniref:Prostaglandin G/H synthase 2/cyclooxygenase 2, pgh2/cox2 n=1 Tax=Dactylonectria estremocensis TaxID=1079267 RepID=A0A9P9J356_9HYPO|nr:putative prostaglandin G/H synthase 2/cyclooxygenase 2, pgh2/cox2 [Dactylonectria estremocensis]